ncbi:DUF2306 domain-containing protein [Tsukamurella strandjordii]|uniref:DUF2306 domain-containing protein n=1 Tax=Tsukamurella TaxID=2060 RepID=UPI001C7CC5D9|nr:DUF2306 domain-containing protein [Tsukamurella sp. TY48]GIZ97404.1 hypothetical protein TTY48_20160 [Tsukamurella sp. TY48]
MKKLLVGSLIVAAFLAYALPVYLTGGSRVPLDGQPSWYYPLLVGHIMLGAIAMLAGLVQLGRRWFARYHRIAGRIYVACAVPVGLASITVGAMTPFGPANAVSNVTLGALMLLFTVLGVRSILARDVTHHRRWMLRSAALMYSVIINRVLAPIIFLTLDGLGLEPHVVDGLGVALTAWLSWLIALGVCEWWLRRTPRRETGTRSGRTAVAAA